MKRKTSLSVISLAMLGAAGAAHAQSSVTLYGTIDNALTYVNHAAGSKNLWSLGNASSGDLSGTRWGIKGNEDLGGGLAAIFQLENGFDPSTGKLNQGGRIFGRQAYVGLTSNAFGGVAGTVGSEQSYAFAAAYNTGPVSLAAGYFYAANSPASAGIRTGFT